MQNDEGKFNFVMVTSKVQKRHSDVSSTSQSMDGVMNSSETSQKYAKKKLVCGLLLHEQHRCHARCLNYLKTNAKRLQYAVDMHSAFSDRSLETTENPSH